MADRARDGIGIWAAARQVAASLAVLVREIAATVRSAPYPAADRPQRVEPRSWPPPEFAEQGPPQIWLDYVAAHDPAWFDGGSPLPGGPEPRLDAAAADGDPAEAHSTPPRLPEAAVPPRAEAARPLRKLEGAPPSQPGPTPVESPLNEGPPDPRPGPTPGPPAPMPSRQRPRSRLVPAEPPNQSSEPESREHQDMAETPGPHLPPSMPLPAAAPTAVPFASTAPADGAVAGWGGNQQPMRTPAQSARLPPALLMAPLAGLEEPNRGWTKPTSGHRPVRLRPESWEPLRPAPAVPTPTPAGAPSAAGGAADGASADVPTDPWPPLLDMDEPDASVERLPVELAGTVPRLWRQLELGLRDPTIASQRRR